MHLVNGQGTPENSAARACGQVDLDGLKDFVTAARQLQLHGQMTKELHIVARRMEWGYHELFMLSTNLKLGLLDVSWNRNDDVDWVNFIKIVADFQCSPGQRRRHRRGEIFPTAPNRSSGVADCSFELIARGAALSAHDVRRLLRQPLRFALGNALEEPPELHEQEAKAWVQAKSRIHAPVRVPRGLLAPTSTCAAEEGDAA